MALPDNVDLGAQSCQGGRDKAGKGGENRRHAEATHASQNPALQHCARKTRALGFSSYLVICTEFSARHPPNHL